MTQKLDRDAADAQVLQWSMDAGLSFQSIHQPRCSDGGVLGIVIDGRNASAQAVAMTVISILSSRVQRCPIDILVPTSSETELLELWLADEPTVRFIGQLNDADRSAQYLLVCHGGMIFGTFSIESAHDAMEVSGCQLLRAFIDGAPRSFELWRADVLRSVTHLREAERTVIAAGGERWVSGASLGMHFLGRPEPKVFLRKGKAGKFDVNIVVQDTSDPETKRDYLQQIRELEGELQRSRRKQWAAVLEAGPRSAVKIPARALRKGPTYVTLRAAQLVRRVMRKMT